MKTLTVSFCHLLYWVIENWHGHDADLVAKSVMLPESITDNEVFEYISEISDEHGTRIVYEGGIGSGGGIEFHPDGKTFRVFTAGGHWLTIRWNGRVGVQFLDADDHAGNVKCGFWRGKNPVTGVRSDPIVIEGVSCKVCGNPIKGWGKCINSDTLECDCTRSRRRRSRRRLKT